MPIYAYKPENKTECDYCEDGFDYLQKIADPHLTECPECGAPVKRIITAPNIAGSSPSLSEENISKHGFTQYRKLEKGVYEKTAGKGPGIISDKEQ
jgi:putative FmdB family regulatory protein